MRGVNLALALFVHIALGLVWLGFVVDGAYGGGDWTPVLALLWFAAVAATIAWRKSHPGLLWTLPLAWLVSVFAPVFGLLAAVAGVMIWIWGRGTPQPAAGGNPSMPVSDGIEQRIADLERRLHMFASELAALRRDVEAQRTGRPVAETPIPAPTPPSAPVPRPPPRPQPDPERAPFFELPTIRLPELTAARALAWAGGAVTLLGIVFFFVLAVNRGWISRELRLGFGAAASIAVFSAGAWLHSRYGQVYSALAAVGAGIAGGFATLLAATALYGFVSDLGALAAAAAIAAVAVATALAWSSQIVAGLGLIGALLVPLMVLFEEDELSVVGTAFVAIVLAATAIVALRKRWRELLWIAGAASGPQFAVLVAQSEESDWAVIALTGVASALYLAIGIAHHLAVPSERLHPLTTTSVLFGAVLAGVSTPYLISGETSGVDHEGAVFLLLSVVHAALGAYFFLRERDLSSLLWAAALVLAAVGAAELVSGTSLAIVWAAEAAALAWLAARTGETRFQLAGVAYLVLAAAYALGFEAPPTELFNTNRHPAEGAGSVVAVALAALLVARYARRPEERPRSAFAKLLADAENAAYRVRPAYVWAAAAFALYAASLGILELSEWIEIGSVQARFEHGHVFVTLLWALVAFGLVEAGVRRFRTLDVAGLVLLGITLVKTLTFDSTELTDGHRSLAFLAVAAAALLIGFEYQRLSERLGTVISVAVACVAVSFALAVAAVVELVDGERAGVDLQGLAFLGLAAVYATFAALVFPRARHRDLSTLLWLTALVLVAAASVELVDGMYLTLALAAVAAGLAGLAVVAGERRFYLGSLGFLALALGNAVVLEAPPDELFSANRHPGEGAPSLAFVVAAAVALALLLRPAPSARTSWTFSGELKWSAVGDELVARIPLWRTVVYALAGVLALYAASLAILELVQWASPAGVDTDFQRGHTAVSALWGLVGLILLYLGLRRRSRALRLAGFALFGISLAKLFLYDLSYLSSLTRAVSFLAIGAVLLLGGFFYQRLSEQLDERERAETPPAKRPAT